MSYIKLADTLVIPFSTCNSAGALTNADALPVVVVRDNGVDLAYVPVVTQISAGRYEVAIVASGANGFTVGHHCSVWLYTNVATVSVGDGIGWFNVLATATDDLATTTALTAAQTDITTLLARLSATRAGYLDNLSGGAVALASALATAEADITTLLGRLTALRAGYLDNLSAGAVAQASALATVQSDTDDIQTRLPAALVGGKMDSHVNDIAANAITAASIATDAIDADALKADAVTEIQAGLSTAASLATAQTAITDIQSRIPAALGANGNIKADIRDILGTASAAPTVAGIMRVEDAVTQSRLTALRAGYLDNLSAGAVALASALATAQTAITAIKASTDNLPSDPADESIIIAATTAIAATQTAIAASIAVVQAGLFINGKLDKTVYNASKFLTSGRWRVFANKAAADAAVDGHADNADGEVYRFLVTGVDEGDGTVKTFELARDL